MSPVRVTLAAEMTDAIRLGFATLRKLMAADEPKVALRAVGEVSRLLSVCVRLGVALPEREAAADVPPPPPAEVTTPPATPRPAFTAGVSQSRPDRTPTPPAAGRAFTPSPGVPTDRTSTTRAGPSAGVIA